MLIKRAIPPALVLLLVAFIGVSVYAEVELTDLGFGYPDKWLNPGDNTDMDCDIGDTIELGAGAIVMKVAVRDVDFPADDQSSVYVTAFQVNNRGTLPADAVAQIVFLDQDNRCISTPQAIANWGQVFNLAQRWVIPDDGEQVLQVAIKLEDTDTLGNLYQDMTLQLSLVLTYQETPSHFPGPVTHTSPPIYDTVPERVWNGGFETAQDNNYNGGLLPIGQAGIVQEFTLCDSDYQQDEPVIKGVWVQNVDGNANQYDLDEIDLYVKGQPTPIASKQVIPPGANLTTTPFKITPDDFAYKIPDDSCTTFQIGVVVSHYAYPGNTIQFHTTVYVDEPLNTPIHGGNADGDRDPADAANVAWEISDGTAEVIGVAAPPGMDLIAIGSPPKLPAGGEGFVTLHWTSHDPEEGLGAIQGTLIWNPDVLDPVDDPYDQTDDDRAFEVLADHYLIRSAEIDHRNGRASFVFTYDFEPRSTPLIQGDLFRFKARGVGSAGDWSQLDLELTQVIAVFQVRDPITGGVRTVTREITPNVKVAPALVRLVLLGDVDGNGRITINDAILVANYLIDPMLFPLTEEQLLLADVNQDSEITSADVAAIARLAVSSVSASTAAQAAQPLMVSQILAYPNPVVSAGAVRFVVEGQGIESIKVEVFDLTGKRVFNSGFVMGNTLEWDLLDNEGLTVANGVYLYIVTVRGWDGQVVRSEVRKLVILE